MKGKSLDPDTITQDWIYDCVDMDELKQANEILGNDKSKKNLKRLAEERISLFTVGPSGTQKKEAEEIRLKGNSFVSSKDFAKAKECYTNSIKIDPTEASNFANRSLTHLKLGNSEKAMEDAVRAIKVNKDYGRGYQRLAEAYIAQKNYKKAYVALKAASKKDPSNKSVTTLMAEAQKNILEGGIQISESESEKEANELIQGKFYSGKPAYEEVKKKHEPMEDIKGAPSGVSSGKHKKGSPEVEAFFAPLNRVREEAKELVKNGKYDDAMQKYMTGFKQLEKLKSAKNAPDEKEFAMREAVLNNNIAICYKQKQEPSGAVEYATKVIESPAADNDMKLKAYIIRGYGYEAIDKIKKAKEDWTKVKELQPANIDASKALSRIMSALAKDEQQAKIDAVGEAIRNLEEYKKRGNEQYKASIFNCGLILYREL